MRRASIVVLSLLSITLGAGCRTQREEPEEVSGQQGEGGGEGVPEQGIAELARFESRQALEEYFKDQIIDNNSRFLRVPDFDDADLAAGEAAGEVAAEAGDGADGAVAAPPGGADGRDADSAITDFSGTTIQEEGVDEADVVKTDGQYLYVLTNSQLQIVSAQPPEALELLSATPLAAGSVRDLYLVGDRAVTISSQFGAFLPEGGFGVAVGPVAVDAVTIDADETDSTIAEPRQAMDELLLFAPWFRSRPQTIVTVIDVSDRAAPAIVSKTTFDGTASASRMIGGVLRMVLANLPDYYYDVLPLGAPEEDLRLAEIDLDTLMPDFLTETSDGRTRRGNVVEWEGFFRPVDPNGFGVTTLITLDTAEPDHFDAVAVVAEPGLIYASNEAMYLTDTEYHFDFRRTDTDIYKFTYTPDSVRLVAAGKVTGRILNQYSMGEYQGFLRVATTTDQLFDFETGQRLPSTNAVYVLGEQDGELAVVGSVEGIAPGEQVQSARFLGDRGYVVTFEQIDPFFTLELSDPTNPRIVGELKIPGFSTFLTPLDEDHLLAVGVYVDPSGFGFRDGVQLSIFDVSDFAQPRQIHNVIIGNEGTSSEATWNPKAFTYFANQDLLALPVDHFGRFFFDDNVVFEDAGGGVSDGSAGEEGIESVPQQAVAPPFVDSEQFQGLYVYRVTPEAGFDFLGRISTRLDGVDHWWTSFTRGVFIEDHVYAVTERAVVSAPTAAVSEAVGAVELPGAATFEESEPGPKPEATR